MTEQESFSSKAVLSCCHKNRNATSFLHEPDRTRSSFTSSFPGCTQECPCSSRSFTSRQHSSPISLEKQNGGPPRPPRLAAKSKPLTRVHHSHHRSGRPFQLFRPSSAVFQLSTFRLPPPAPPSLLNITDESFTPFINARKTLVFNSLSLPSIPLISP